MNEKTYSEHWERESNQLERQGVYKRLNEIAPTQDVIEIGCGAGLGTQHLAASRRVLSIDNNIHLISKAKARLENAGLSAKFIHADLFDLSPQHVATIKEFSPIVIIAWLIGSHPDDVDKHTPASTPINEKFKKYRENVEDLIVSENICPPSVEWIHLALRGARNEKVPSALVCKETKEEYNTLVFASRGFEVTDVHVIEWKRDGSDFMYINGPNEDLTPNQAAPCIFSVLAKRILS